MTRALTIQPAMPAITLARLDGRRKLLPLPWVAVFLGLDADQSLELAENHFIFPSFDLATRATGKRKIHVWRGSVENYSPGQSITVKPSLAEVITATLPLLGVTPAATATVKAVDLAWRLCLSPSAVAKLIQAGELREVGPRNPARETARISRASAVTFLERRLL